MPNSLKHTGQVRMSLGCSKSCTLALADIVVMTEVVELAADNRAGLDADVITVDAQLVSEQPTELADDTGFTVCVA